MVPLTPWPMFWSKKFPAPEPGFIKPCQLGRFQQGQGVGHTWPPHHQWLTNGSIKEGYKKDIWRVGVFSMTFKSVYHAIRLTLLFIITLFWADRSLWIFPLWTLELTASIRSPGSFYLRESFRTQYLRWVYTRPSQKISLCIVFFVFCVILWIQNIIFRLILG